MPNNIGHSDFFPSALEGDEETGIEGWVPGAEDLGILGTDIT